MAKAHCLVRVVKVTRHDIRSTKSQPCHIVSNNFFKFINFTINRSDQNIRYDFFA